MNIESQIQQALRQAELFSQTLQSAREQEKKALQTLEEERVKWSHNFEEKSILIDQLERELEATVDALHSNPNSSKLEEDELNNSNYFIKNRNNNQQDSFDGSKINISNHKNEKLDVSNDSYSNSLQSRY